MDLLGENLDLSLRRGINSGSHPWWHFVQSMQWHIQEKLGTKNMDLPKQKKRMHHLRKHADQVFLPQDEALIQTCNKLDFTKDTSWPGTSWGLVGSLPDTWFINGTKVNLFSCIWGVWSPTWQPSEILISRDKSNFWHPEVQALSCPFPSRGMTEIGDWNVILRSAISEQPRTDVQQEEHCGLKPHLFSSNDKIFKMCTNLTVLTCACRKNISVLHMDIWVRVLNLSWHLWQDVNGTNIEWAGIRRITALPQVPVTWSIRRIQFSCVFSNCGYSSKNNFLCMTYGFDWESCDYGPFLAFTERHLLSSRSRHTKEWKKKHSVCGVMGKVVLLCSTTFGMEPIWI